MNHGYHPSVPLEVGVSPKSDVSEFLAEQHGLMQTAGLGIIMHLPGQYHAFAQQRLNVDRMSAVVQKARDHLHMGQARNRQKQYADSERRDLQLMPGQDVMLKTDHLNLSRWPSRKLFPL